jgi:hypothetical protein
MAKADDKPEGNPELRIADLERELRLKDERINELKDEIDEDRDLIRRLREHAEEHDEYLEGFISTFGLVLTDDGKWSNGEAIEEQIAQAKEYDDLIREHNKLVHRFNRNIADVNPVGRPIAADEEEQEQILWHHKQGRSLRWIAEEMSLSRRTVTTVITKVDGSDRTTNTRRLKLGLEPKRKDWRLAAMGRLPGQAAKHLGKGRDLVKEAKGLK